MGDIGAGRGDGIGVGVIVTSRPASFRLALAFLRSLTMAASGELTSVDTASLARQPCIYCVETARI